MASSAHKTTSHGWLGQIGSSPEDIDGNGEVGIICDGIVLHELMGMGTAAGPPLTGSTAAVSATYNSNSGNRTSTIVPGCGGSCGVTGVYLINKSSSISIALTPTAGTVYDTSSPVISLIGHSNNAYSSSVFDSSLTDALGSGSLTSYTFSVSALTPVSDLEFFYQQIAKPPIAMTVFDSATGQSFTSRRTHPCLHPVPKPSIFGAALLFAAALRLRRKDPTASTQV